ncbi:MAG: hypothetical protein M1334_00715 [Patescibacteria group bacterium]|nr:hypothetical protein [Patescibacteria group bacterium]
MVLNVISLLVGLVVTVTVIEVIIFNIRHWGKLLTKKDLRFHAIADTIVVSGFGFGLYTTHDSGVGYAMDIFLIVFWGISSLIHFALYLTKKDKEDARAGS